MKPAVLNSEPVPLIEDGAIEKVLSVLEAGGLVAIPTETVYGLAADATNGDAVARIFKVKGRPEFNPLICHVSGLAMAQRFGAFDEKSLKLANAFWPGPLTLIVPVADGSNIHELVTAGLGTIGLRCPQGRVRDIIRSFDRPLAAPSANVSGKISPTSVSHVMQDLGDKIDLALDGGPCPVGLESTIVKVMGDKVVVLRDGGVTRDAIEDCIGEPVITPKQGQSIEAPGMMRSHYAPESHLRLNATDVREDEVFIAFGEVPDNAKHALTVFNLSETSDLAQAATRLFEMLKAADQQNCEYIAVAPIPFEGLGIAINDRLSRAAAPRDQV